MLWQTPEFGIAESFAIALLIGALVGIEREKKKADSQKPSFAGIRTFVLLSETGAVSAWLALQTQILAIFPATLVGLLVLVTAAYLLERRADPASVGLTTELAALTAFLLGAAVMFGHAALAVALAVVNTSLLAFKDPLHGAIQKLGKDDIFAVLKLLIASFIVLPLLPHQPVDPWNALNPYKLWLLVILISGLSLVGYVATRWLGSARGVAVTGVTGGLVSSTAVTLSMARESRNAVRQGDVALDDAYAAGVLVAWLVMFARVVVMVLVLNASLLKPLAVPVVAMVAANAGFAAWFYVRSLRDAARRLDTVAEVPLKNPFSLWSATKFGLLFAVVLLMVEISRRSFPASGVVYVAVLAGLTDVDAITLSMADVARDPAQITLATQAIVAVILSNTIAKAGLAFGLGSRGLGRRVAWATGAVALAGMASVWLA